MTAALEADERGAWCQRCRTQALATFRCAACGDRRNRQVARRMTRWWGTASVASIGLVALFLIGASLHERGRQNTIAAREARLVGVRAEQRDVEQRIAVVASATEKRRKAGADLIKRQPRLKQQLSTAKADVARLGGERDRLRGVIATGVLAPGASV